jgi:hypothetical protein
MESKHASIGFFLWALTASLLYAQPDEKVQLVSSNLPILSIDTHGREILDTPRITAHLGIIYNGQGKLNRLTDAASEYDGRIDIELRGATSAAFPKRPYRFETVDAKGENLNVPLLGMPAENDWILHNPYSDKSLIRNIVAYKLARDLGAWASRTRLCELVLNGEYMGVYVLLEKIKRDKNRLAIATLAADDITGDDLTGGYIIKIDRLSGEQRAFWETQYGSRYHYHYPAPEHIQAEQRTYIERWMSSFEAIMSQANYSDLKLGYPQYIDVQSFVDYFLVNEITRNVDAYRLSFYLYKDKDSKDNRLKATVWDFNFALGNANYYAGQETAGWNIDQLTAAGFNDSFRPPFWWKKLRQDKRFMLRAALRWQAMRTAGWRAEKLASYIDSLALELGAAQARNFARWPILGQTIEPNAFVGQSHQEEIDYLKSWLATRAQWMDRAFAEIVAAADSSDFVFPPQQSFLYPSYPNPFRTESTIRYDLLQPTNVEIAIFNSVGQRVTMLVDEPRPAGTHTVVWRKTNAADLATASGVYYVRMRAGAYTETRKLLLVK